MQHLAHTFARPRNSQYVDHNRADRSMLKIASTYPSPTGGVPGGYLADKDGELAFAFTYRDGAETLQRWADGKWQACPVNLDEVEVLGPGDRPGELMVACRGGPGRPGPMRRLDAATGRLGGIVYQDSHYDIGGGRLYRDPVSHRVLGIQYNRLNPESAWFDPGFRALQSRFEGTFPGEGVRILGSDRRERRFVVETFSDVDPGAFYLVDLGGNSVKLLGRAAPWMDPRRMRPMHSFSYRARDGVVVEAYLTLPAGTAKGRPAPLVVFPHGGPWLRDAWGFNPWVQFLASRGYAVFQPNYRGSPGYTWRYPEGDKYDFVKMRNDVTDGVSALVESGLVDPGRMAIFGESFGGYLALCGAAFEPGLYRCAITLSGVSDWGNEMAELRSNDDSEDPELLFLERHLGDPKKDRARFDEISPLRHVDRIRIPIFVYHGWDDPIAAIDESTRLVDALDDHHVPYEKHFSVDEEHGLSHFVDAMEVFGSIEALLARNMGKPSN
jgi:acetyl esterase/lipase